MAQHDMNIANQGFPATRADLNNALQAIATNNSGTSAPSTTFANQWFYNTNTNKLFIRNEANNAFIEVATLDQTNNEWQITTGVIQAKDGDGLALKTDDGTTRINISDAGNVGIGMAPSQLLDLEATSGLSIRFNNSGSFKAGIQVADSSGQMIGTSVANDLAIRSQSDILFSSNGNTERLRIDNTGTVGIGSGAPNPTKLAILAGGSSQGVLLARNASGNPTSGQDLGSFGFKGIMDGSNSLNASEARITAQAAEDHTGSTAGTHLDFYTKPSSIGPGSGPSHFARLTHLGTMQMTSFGCGAIGADSPMLTATKTTISSPLNFDFVCDVDTTSWRPVGFYVHVSSIHSGAQRQRSAFFYIRGGIFNGSLTGGGVAASGGDTSDVSVAISDQGGTDPMTIRVAITSPNNRTVATVQAHNFMGIISVS